MAAATLPQDALLPQAPGGLAPGAAAALLVHAGLIAALTLGIDWRSREPETVVAELWSAVPQIAAPAPPPPAVAAPLPPPPVARPEVRPDADIALDRERRQKAEQKKAEDDKKRADAETERKRKADEKKAEAERKKLEAAEAARVAEEKAEDERLAKQRQENLRRMMGLAGSAPAAGTSGTAAQSSGPSANYLARLRKQVRDAVSFTGTVPDSATTEVAVTTASGGTILTIKVIKKSGYPDWDEAVVRGLEKLGSLARDTDGRVPPSLTLVFRRND